MERLSTITDRIEAIRRSRPFIRSAAAALLAFKDKTAVVGTAERIFAKDVETLMLTRAAVSPLSTANTGTFISTAVTNFISILAPFSALAALLAAGALKFEFGRAGALRVPSLLATNTDTGFVLEGNPIPVHQYAFGGGLLALHKLASISVYSAELLEHSIPSIEAMLRALLSESVGLAADTAAFSAVAGSATRPAGLLVGLAAETAAAASPGTSAAMLADVATVATKVSAVGSNIVLIASPAQAIALRMHNRIPFPILASAALTSTVIAVVPEAIVVAIDPIPNFSVSDQSTVVVDDAPSGSLMAGTPVRSLWQTNELALRTILQCDFALRSPLGIAFINTNW